MTPGQKVCRGINQSNFRCGMTFDVEWLLQVRLSSIRILDGSSEDRKQYPTVLMQMEEYLCRRRSNFIDIVENRTSKNHHVDTWRSQLNWHFESKPLNWSMLHVCGALHLQWRDPEFSARFTLLDASFWPYPLRGGRNHSTRPRNQQKLRDDATIRRFPSPNAATRR